MKTISLRFIAMACAIGIFASSCRNQEDLGGPAPAKPTYASGYAELEENRVAFAKVLARAMGNEAVRSLLKREAEKQFDQDTEVLFHLIKDENIDPQTTLFDYLSSLHGSAAEFKKITNSLPLLTILVPHLGHFTAEKWNVHTHVPIVAALANDKPDGEKARILPAFDASGKEQALQKNVWPTFPVLVVKDNERLYVRGQNAGAKAAKSGKVAYVSGDFSYIFTDESFDGRTQKSADEGKSARVGPASSFDQRVIFAYDNRLQFHRDYVYYGIAPELGVNTGTLNNNYGEFITAIRFKDTNSAYTVYDDWSDGNFEFLITVSFVDNKTNLGSITKAFSVPFDNLFSYSTNADGSTTVNSTREYTIPGKGHFIQVWDMQRYGDTWKFTCLEKDQQTVQTFSINSTVTSNYGTNYTNNVKDGPNFGSTTATGSSFAMGYSIAVTGGSDQLGEGFLNWKDKILWSKATIFASVTGFSYPVETGTLELTVEPRYRY